MRINISCCNILRDCISTIDQDALKYVRLLYINSMRHFLSSISYIKLIGNIAFTYMVSAHAQQKYRPYIKAREYIMYSLLYSILHVHLQLYFMRRYARRSVFKMYIIAIKYIMIEHYPYRNIGDIISTSVFKEYYSLKHIKHILLLVILWKLIMEHHWTH